MPAPTTRGRELPLFAQPLPNRLASRRFPEPLLEAESWAGTALLFLPAALCLALLVVARPDGAQNLPANAQQAREKFQVRAHRAPAPIRLAQNNDKSSEA